MRACRNEVVGRVAQLGERGVRNAEVEGSNPFASTILSIHLSASSVGLTPRCYQFWNPIPGIVQKSVERVATFSR